MDDDVLRRVTPCEATPDSPHPATRKSGLCDFHHRERALQMGAYRTAASKFNKTRNPKHDPGSKKEFEANIRYTPLEDVWTMLNAVQRSAIRNQAAADTAAATVLRRIVSKPSMLTSNPPQGIATAIADYLKVHSETIRLLESLGADPDTEA